MHRRHPTTALLPVVLVALLATGLVGVAPGAPAADAAARTSGIYADDDGSPHEEDVEALAATGLTRGCALGRYCPTAPVTRGQMAAFLDRALGLPATGRDWFLDDDDSIFEDEIDRLRAAGVTNGCNPPANDRYCPDAPITREQMAAFLTAALELPASDRDWFLDDDGSQFEPAIQALRRSGITKGCDPPDNRRYCPRDTVTRGQFASFLARALDLEPPTPPGVRCDPATHACTASDATHPVALTWDGIELRLPSSATELLGMHQSSHEGARHLTLTGDGAPGLVLPSRGRGTGRSTAADIVGHPAVEVRSPVTGTVVRSGTYTLYCRYSDDFLVIEPDGRPGIEVKLLHIDGVTVRAGDRVVAGVTVVAPRLTVLPFASQVDDWSGPSDWPHTHLEVVDTSIPNEPGNGGC